MICHLGTCKCWYGMVLTTDVIRETHCIAPCTWCALSRQWNKSVILIGLFETHKGREGDARAEEQRMFARGYFTELHWLARNRDSQNTTQNNDNRGNVRHTDRHQRRYFWCRLRCAVDNTLHCITMNGYWAEVKSGWLHHSERYNMSGEPDDHGDDVMCRCTNCAIISASGTSAVSRARYLSTWSSKNENATTDRWKCHRHIVIRCQTPCSSSSSIITTISSNKWWRQRCDSTGQLWRHRRSAKVMATCAGPRILVSDHQLIPIT